MKNWYPGLVVLMAVALVVAGCGPQMATPTTRPQETTAATAALDLPTPTAEPIALEDLPLDPNDWRALGSPDAPVTLIEYSDFQ